MNAIEIKHLTKNYSGFSLENLSLTLPKGQSAPETRFSFASDAARYAQGDQRQLRLIAADSLVFRSMI